MQEGRRASPDATVTSGGTRGCRPCNVAQTAASRMAQPSQKPACRPCHRVPTAGAGLVRESGYGEGQGMDDQQGHGEGMERGNEHGDNQGDAMDQRGAAEGWTVTPPCVACGSQQSDNDQDDDDADEMRRLDDAIRQLERSMGEREADRERMMQERRVEDPNVQEEMRRIEEEMRRMGEEMRRLLDDKRRLGDEKRRREDEERRTDDEQQRENDRRENEMRRYEDEMMRLRDDMQRKDDEIRRITDELRQRGDSEDYIKEQTRRMKEEKQRMEDDMRRKGTEMRRLQEMGPDDDGYPEPDMDHDGMGDETYDPSLPCCDKDGEDGECCNDVDGMRPAPPPPRPPPPPPPRPQPLHKYKCDNTTDRYMVLVKRPEDNFDVSCPMVVEVFEATREDCVMAACGRDGVNIVEWMGRPRRMEERHGGYMDREMDGHREGPMEEPRDGPRDGPMDIRNGEHKGRHMNESRRMDEPGRTIDDPDRMDGRGIMDEPGRNSTGMCKFKSCVDDFRLSLTFPAPEIFILATISQDMMPPQDNRPQDGNRDNRPMP